MEGKKSKITIKDLAIALNTSTSTVSRALKNHPKISEEMKVKVRDVAVKMGYINSIQAAIQQNFNNKIIGIIIPSLQQTKYSIIIESAREVFENSGYKVVVSCTSESSILEEQTLHMFENLNVEGVIASLTFENRNPTYFDIFTQHKPLVLFDRISFDFPCDKIMIDHFQASFRAVQHLLNNGCNTIAHMGGNIKCPLSKQISTGYKTAIKKSEKKLNPKLEIFSDHLLEDIVKATEIVFSQKEKPDAILVDDVLAAQKLISILHTQKIRVPEDVSIIAISDEKDYSYYSPSITTIQLPYSKVGISAAKKLIEKIDNNKTENNNEIIVEPFYLNIRNSTLKN